MATTTPNFGWAVPTSTDLVKDGAVAIETLGDSIDASLVDLKGGTTGQVLAKASGTDMDFSWVAQDDSNAIQNAIVDAKGDLIAATANDTPARLAVGANSAFLQADSTTATGLKWNNDAWISFTPTLTASTTNPTLGTGSNRLGYYTQIGKLIIYAFEVRFGSSGASAGSGNYRISLPVTAKADPLYARGGSLTYNDASAFTARLGVAIIADPSYVELNFDAGTFYVTNSAPFTWSNDDGIRGTLIYEAA
jgi:hypothetical protein